MPAPKQGTEVEERKDAKTEEDKPKHRVVVAGISWFDDQKDRATGETVKVYKTAQFGQEVTLPDEEFDRLQTLGSQKTDGTRGPAVVLASEPLGTAEMDEDALEKKIEEYGLTPTATGVDGKVTKDDMINSITAFEEGGRRV